MGNTMSLKITVKSNELPIGFWLNNFNTGVKLILNHLKKIKQGKSLNFAIEEEEPCEPRITINDNEKVMGPKCW